MNARVPCPTVYPEVTTHYAGGRVETRQNVPCEGSLHECPICGKVRYCGRESRCLDVHAPSHVVRARFAIDDCMYGYEDEGGIPGYTRGEHWNGWECPRFEYREASAIVAYLNAHPCDGGSAEYIEGADAFKIVMPGSDAPDFYPGAMFETADGPRKVYAIGAWAWIWDRIEPTADEDDGGDANAAL